MSPASVDSSWFFAPYVGLSAWFLIPEKQISICCLSFKRYLLDGVFGVFGHGGMEAGHGLAAGDAVDTNADLGFVLGSRFAEDGDGAESFGIHASDEVSVPGVFFFPELADLDFGDAHGGLGQCVVACIRL
jgi:hypothetical protein